MADVFFPGNLGPQNWLITPAGLAVGETAPQDILDQKWLVVLTGVLEIDFQGNSTDNWLNETVVFSPDGFPLGSEGAPLNSGPLFWAINQYAIPLPSSDPSAYTVVFSLLEWAPFATLSAIFDQGASINAGFAVNAWRPRHFFNGVSTKFSTPPTIISNIFSGIEVDVGVRDTDAWLLKLSYNITLLGKIAFAASGSLTDQAL
jgi:hypothetical protein